MPPALQARFYLRSCSPSNFVEVGRTLDGDDHERQVFLIEGVFCNCAMACNLRPSGDDRRVDLAGDDSVAEFAGFVEVFVGLGHFVLRFGRPHCPSDEMNIGHNALCVNREIQLFSRPFMLSGNLR